MIGDYSATSSGAGSGCHGEKNRIDGIDEEGHTQSIGTQSPSYQHSKGTGKENGISLGEGACNCDTGGGAMHADGK